MWYSIEAERVQDRCSGQQTFPQGLLVRTTVDVCEHVKVHQRQHYSDHRGSECRHKIVRGNPDVVSLSENSDRKRREKRRPTACGPSELQNVVLQGRDES
ncbi:unnamed protein product, partial [Dicrocoelium dendriticum]